MRRGVEQPLVYPFRHADIVLGISYLRFTRGDRLEQACGSTMEVGLGRFSLWAALQSLPDLNFTFRAPGGLSLLRHVGWFDDSDLYHRHVSTAGQVTGILLGAVAREGRG